MKPPEIRNRNWFDRVVDELFEHIHVPFWQLLVIGILLGIALGVAVGAAAP